jgi:BolA protein
MTIQGAIEAKLSDNLAPQYCEVINESHMHNVPPNSETHFKVVLVSAVFEGLRSVARHQKIYRLLSEELAGPVHALSLHTYSDEEWQQRAAPAPTSPDCMGQNKAS